MQFSKSLFLLPAAVLMLGANVKAAPKEHALTPAVKTLQVPDDADDPAIWLHPTDRSKSVVLGTNKAAAPTGGLYVFGMDGRIRQAITSLDRPNNVDVEYGFQLGNRKVDIAVVTERYKRRLRVFAVENGRLRDLAPNGIPVFEGQEGEMGAPMGIALYKRPRDGQIFAIVSRKSGPKQGYLWQYRLTGNAKGEISATKVREFGAFSGDGEIESVVVDDELGYVYYSDESLGYRKWHADPTAKDAGSELAIFGTEALKGDREGLAILPMAGGKGYIVATEQLKTSESSGSVYRLYRRDGSALWPHDHSECVGVLAGGADETDGIEAVSIPLNADFKNGMLVAMNSNGRNFWYFSLDSLGQARQLATR